MPQIERIAYRDCYYSENLTDIDIEVNVPIDFIGACIYIPGQIRENGYLSRFWGTYEGFVRLDLSYATAGREYQILGYRVNMHGEKQIVAARHGKAEELRNMRDIDLVTFML